MSQLQFDPYQDWLGLPAIPNSFYGLLGLSRFESDLDAIQKAAHQTTLTVRNIKPGEHIQAWKQLLDQIEQARELLTDPELKAKYDERLLSSPLDQLSAVASNVDRKATMKRLDPMAPLEDVPAVPPQSAPAPSPLDVPQPPTQLPPHAAPSQVVDTVRNNDPREAINAVGRSMSSTSPSTATRKVYRRRTRRNQQFNTRIAVILLGISFVGMVAAFWLVLQLDPWSLRMGTNTRTAQPSSSDALVQSTTENVARKPISSSRQPVEVTHQPAAPARSETTSPSDVDMTPTMSVEVESVPVVNAAPTQAEVAKVRGLLIEAHLALNDRDFQQGEALLSQIRSLPMTSENEAMVERFATLQEYVVEFWEAVEDGTQQVEGAELKLDQTTVFVVEVNSQSIVLRVLGKNRRIDRRQLPSGLAIALADQWFDQQASSTKVFKGAYMAVTPRYHAAEVKQMWTDAANEGAELGDLMEVLGDRERLGLQNN